MLPIFVYEADEGDHLKMIDFGFVTRFEADQEIIQPCGSLHYVGRTETACSDARALLDLLERGTAARRVAATPRR